MVIKRYKNRKLYNTETAAYTTLGEILANVKAGTEITVVDNVSKKDITKETVLMALTTNAALVSMTNVLALARSEA